ncbi:MULTISPECIES: hypothetical protein [Spiroplasma]|uniref:Uncharacterized protein n=2 Tax=Spiroplasma TaxID=2132 RepID=W6AP67_9MOLU|nr:MULTISPECIES: hypothetical protein [Spiroplasma]AHF58171.1 hypothetical protein SPE_1056 [Spiroplasma eriocheiris CCTCC M 207170]AHI58515.1 hypothetical protein P344_06040 [Spiroplasma mirum ATCC 29335]AKM53439.1 hypothetical protein SATRI_v1c10780 [Spiroplasma atrichopogonis]AKM54608.1 hypothetical protein SERIO_v1c10520 [Spiroplasma eriocheiris]
MKPELIQLLQEIKLKMNDEKLFDSFLGEILNEANYNNYYEQSVANEEIAEQLVEIYFIEIYKDDEELTDLEDKIMKILFYLEGDEKLVSSYSQYIDTKVSEMKKELK